MILLKKCLLAFFGLCAGGIIAAGVYAFLAIIGVYETVIILGGVLGNILDIYEFPIYMGPYIGTLFICVFGLSVGIFVGCLVMSLAETLKALPVISRRIHLAVGLQYLIFALAAGKMAGSLVYFWNHMASLG